MSSREDELERALIVATERIEELRHTLAKRDAELRRVTEDLVTATERIEELETLLRVYKIALEELRRPHGFLQD